MGFPFHPPSAGVEWLRRLDSVNCGPVPPAWGGANRVASPTPATLLREDSVYESLDRGSIGSDGRDGVSHHRGACADFLRRHERRGRQGLKDGVRGARASRPTLLARVADARTLRLAWTHLAERGGPAPGPDGRRFADYTAAEVWDLCRCLAEAIRAAGTYRPGPEQSQNQQGVRPG